MISNNGQTREDTDDYANAEYDERLGIIAGFTEVLQVYDADDDRGLHAAIRTASGTVWRIDMRKHTDFESADADSNDLAALHAEVDGMREAIIELVDLMAESDGITGYHQNGDVASWEELIDDRENLAEAIRRCRAHG